jgi:phosphoesterase RecJ-like protein
MYKEANEIRKIIGESKTIAVVQADNPDTDSLASSLALEQILGDIGKETVLYSGIELPSYLKNLPGADRLVQELPNQFDSAVIVDTASRALLTKAEQTGIMSRLAAHPVIIIDHHATEPTIDFAKVVLSPTAVATGEVIYELAKHLAWPLSHEAKRFLAMAILSDSQGLTSESTTARSIHIIAELVEGGVSLAELEDARRASLRRNQELVHYKGELLQRVEFHHDGRIALLSIPWEEIEKYSPLYNPPMLVLDDMRLAKDCRIAVAFKLYHDGKITAKIRTNYGYGIADKLAEHFGGGGHPYAAGFKLTDGRNYETVKQEFLTKAQQLLDAVK